MKAFKTIAALLAFAFSWANLWLAPKLIDVTGFAARNRTPEYGAQKLAYGAAIAGIVLGALLFINTKKNTLIIVSVVLIALTALFGLTVHNCFATW